MPIFLTETPASARTGLFLVVKAFSGLSKNKLQGIEVWKSLKARGKNRRNAAIKSYAVL